MKLTAARTGVSEVSARAFKAKHGPERLAEAYREIGGQERLALATSSYLRWNQGGAGRMPTDDNSPSATVQTFRREQLAELSTALPFPDIDWSKPEQSLADLRNYVESLASSTISWYLRKIIWKRILARTLNVLTIATAAVAALIQLLNISTLLNSQWVKDVFHICTDGCSSGRAAEFTLLFIGIAGGFKVIDHVAGNRGADLADSDFRSSPATPWERHWCV